MPETFDLEDAIAQALSDHRFKEQQKQKVEDQLSAEKQRQNESVFYTALLTELGGDAYEALNITVTCEPAKNYETRADFADGDSKWWIERDAPDNVNRRGWRFGCYHVQHYFVKDGELLNALLLRIAERRVALEQQAIERGRMQEEQRVSEERRLQRAGVLHEASEDVWKEIEGKRARWLLENAFIHYPVTLYKLTYMAGAKWDFDGENKIIDYRSLYCPFDKANVDGYLVGYTSDKRRIIKLDRELHMPVWERIEYASVDELPSELVEHISLELTGYRFAWQGDISESIWVRGSDSDHEWIPDSGLNVPVKWVRDLAFEQSKSRLALRGILR